MFKRITELCSRVITSFFQNERASANFLLVILNSFMLLMLVAISSCSVKSDKQEEVSKIESLTEEDVLRDLNGNSLGKDKDSDGLSDKLEIELGRSIDIGIFPSFSVEKLRFTTLKLKGIGNTRDEVKITYSTDDDPLFQLDYTPIKDKIARNSYFRTIGDHGNYTNIDLYDSGIIKISNFDEKKNTEIKKIIQDNDDNNWPTSFSLQSVFKLNVSDIKGIVKIFDIEVNLGFIDKEGQFSSFGEQFQLLTTNQTRAVVSSDGLVDTGLSNMEVLIYADRLGINDLRDVFDEEHDLAVRIVNYKAETLEGNIFEYSPQISKASEKCILYAISTPDSNRLLFDSRSISVAEAVKTEFSTIEHDNEGTLISAGEFRNNTSYPIVFEESGNHHLEQSSWHLFSSQSKVTDKPEYGEIVSLGYFSNYELAQAGERINILDSERINIADRSDVVCDINDRACIDRLNNGNTLDSSDLVKVEDLNLGETVEFVIKGYNLKKNKVMSLNKLIATSSYDYRRCRDTWDSRGVDCEEGTSRTRHDCNYNWIDIKLNKVDYLDLTEEEVKKILKINAKNANNLAFSDESFFNLQKLTKDYDLEGWRFQLLITKDFLEKYGESLYLGLNKTGPKLIEKGFHSLKEDEWCFKYASSHMTNDCLDAAASINNDRVIACYGWRGSSNRHGRFWHNTETEDGHDLRNVEVEVNRFFSK